MATKKLTKVQKVAKETGVEEKKLDRLPLDALNVLDEMTPDEDELLGTEITIKEPEIIAVISPKKKGKTLLGFHPITGEEVYL